MDLPEGLELSRHRDLEGRGWIVWVRRAAIAALAALILAALLNAFGQLQTTSTARSPAASLTVTSPPRVRGGLMYQARFTVHAYRPIHNLNLVMNQGWFDQTTVNGIEPQPATQTSDADQIKLAFGSLDAGRTLPIFVYFQVNPTNIGSHDTSVSLADGTQPLVSISRSQFNFP